MSNQSFKVKSGLTLTPVDLTTLINPQAGDIACDSNDNNKIKRWDGANWVQVGSGGVGGLDFLFTQDFEEATLATFTQVGLSLDTVTELHGKVSAKLVHQAGVSPTNDQYFKEVRAVDPKFRGKNHTIQLTVKSAASAGNVVLKITDETASTDLVLSEQLQLSNNAGGASSSVSFDIPETCLSLSYTITALPEAGSPVTIIDDIYCALTASNLFQSGVVQEEDSAYKLTNFTFRTVSSICYFNDGVESLVGDAIQIIKSSTNGDNFVALKSGIYYVSFGMEIGSVAGYIYLTKNSTTITPSNNLSSMFDSGSSNIGSGSWSGYLEEGDVLRFVLQSGTSTFTANAYNNISITYQGSLKQVTINSNQKITIPTSELRFEGASSRGTGTETAIVEFTSLAKLRGDAFAIDNSNGTAITMTKAGRLNVHCTLASASVSTFQITKNQTIRTGLSLISSEVLAAGVIAVTSSSNSCSVTTNVNIGDIIRISANAVPVASTNISLNLSFQEQEVQVSVSNTLPQFSESDSCVRLDTANGYGSSGTKIRRFASTRTNIGNDILYMPSAVDGDSFVIQTSGIYNISYSEYLPAAAGTNTFGITKNASSLNTAISSIDVSERLSVNRVASSSIVNGTTSSWSGFLQIGDIIRGQTDGGVSPDNQYVSFTISKVGRPNVTGVDVTPFVNVPQPESQSSFIDQTANFSLATITGPLTSQNGSGIYSYNSSTGIYTVLKSGNFSMSVTFTTPTTATTVAAITIDGSVVASSHAVSNNGYTTTTSYNGILSAGSTFFIHQPSSGTASRQRISILAVALADQILTAPETFSTDTASLTYAGSGTYTLSTLANAPVGTFITFTYAANTNTRTQTLNTAPSQSTGDMNANGIQIFTRAYNAPSTAASPAAIAIQIGKGLKGKSLDLYKSAGKVTSGQIDDVIRGSFADKSGISIKSYNEQTGILLIDAAFNGSANTNANFIFDDLTSQTSGYLVINASKNPALTGFGLNRIAARATSTAGGAIGTTNTLQSFTEEVFDTNGAWNGNTFIAPETGYYQVSAGLMSAIVTIATGGGFVVDLYKNGALYSTSRSIGNGAGNIYQALISDVMFLKKDDTISLYSRSSVATTQNTVAGYNFISISKVSV